MSEIKNELRRLLLSAGAVKVGFAKVEPVDDDAYRRFSSWLEQSHHAEMQYMENYPEIRRDPRLLLEGAKTVISVAFNYYPQKMRNSEYPYIAMYAYGRDYHDVIRQRLGQVCERIKADYGADCRVCVDTAPILERYWAWRAGMGYQGINGTFIIPGKGSYHFLSEIVTTLEIEPDTPIMSDCGNCGRCLQACPLKAINGDCTIDASRCLSYLTIECRNDWELPSHIAPPLYGCDICQQVCHHNRRATPTELPEFAPTEEFLSLDYELLSAMSEEDFRRIFRHSAIKRTKHSGLRRNLSKIKKP